MDTKQFISSINQLVEEKGLPKDKVIETIEMAIAAAYKKNYRQQKKNIPPAGGGVKLGPDNLSFLAVVFLIRGGDRHFNSLNDLVFRQSLLLNQLINRRYKLFCVNKLNYLKIKVRSLGTDLKIITGNYSISNLIPLCQIFQKLH